MRHTVLLTIVVALFTVSAASADPIHYTINFSPLDPLSPFDGPVPSGSFRYDADVPVFADFRVTWPTLQFDFTTGANTMAPGVRLNGGEIVGAVPCVGTLTGAAASFLLMSGACNQPGWLSRWDVGVIGTTDASHFEMFSASLSSNDHISLNLIGAFPQGQGLDPGARGTWTITPTSVPVPEPSVFSPFITGLGAITLFARRRIRRR